MKGKFCKPLYLVHLSGCNAALYNLSQGTSTIAMSTQQSYLRFWGRVAHGFLPRFTIAPAR